MRPAPTCLIAIGFLLVLATGSWAPSACAAVRMDAAKLTMSGVQMRDVHLRLDEQGVDNQLRLRLDAGQVDLKALGWRKVGMRLDGQLVRAAPRRWQFEGGVKLHGAPGGMLDDGHMSLAIDTGANSIEVALEQGKGSATAALPLDQPTHAQVHLVSVPLGWLQGLLAQAWSGHLTGGRVDATLAVDVLDDGLQGSGEFDLAKAGFDSTSGSIAGQSLDTSGRFRLESDARQTRIDLYTRLDGGEVLLGPLYAKLPERAVPLSLTAVSRQGALSLQDLHFHDSDALQVDGGMTFDRKGELGSLHLDRFQASLPAAYDRYGKSWLATLGFDGLTLRGDISGAVDLSTDGLRSFSITARRTDIADGNGRFAVDGLDGSVDWSRSGQRAPTQLGWKALRFYKIANGAATAKLQSDDGALSLRQALRIPVLGGQLIASSLAWRPAAKRGQRLQTSMVLTGIDLKALCKAFGWPAFNGTLAGSMPSLSYADDRFDLAGGLSMQVFGGFADITRLSLQDPFGDAPVLAGDMSLRQLDLAAITGVFDFGSITGRLDGQVDDLRLVNWNPVAFKASLLADKKGRISQRAVNNLTAVGGGGIAAGLQGAVLRLFDTFGYDRIGLKCTLEGDVCHMDGLEPTDNGYLIVDGRGLPHLKVVGHQHEVSWPILVARLKTAIEGNAPVVD